MSFVIQKKEHLYLCWLRIMFKILWLHKLFNIFAILVILGTLGFSLIVAFDLFWYKKIFLWDFWNLKKKTFCLGCRIIFVYCALENILIYENCGLFHKNISHCLWLFILPKGGVSARRAETEFLFFLRIFGGVFLLDFMGLWAFFKVRKIGVFGVYIL